MKRIFKYGLYLTDEQDIEMPAHAVPLHVGYQGRFLHVWVEIEDINMKVKTTFVICGTGYRVPQAVKYIGTAIAPDKDVWHVYYRA